LKRAPLPRSPQQSAYLETCVSNLYVARGTIAVDVGCGFGRHLCLLEERGYLVIALDYDLTALTAVGATRKGSRLAVRCDLDQGMPIAEGKAELVIAIEYPDMSKLGDIASLVAPGGHFVMETFTARGGNWRGLPPRGEIRRQIEEEFRIISIVEKPAGPQKAQSTVKLFAQRRWEPRHGATSAHRHQAW